MQVGSDPSGRSKASASEWAGSVDRIRVRAPRSAHAIAVAAATVVFPTPPFPVKRRMRSLKAVRSSFDPGLELAEGGTDDAALGASLDEPRDGHTQLGSEVVRH